MRTSKPDPVPDARNSELGSLTRNQEAHALILLRAWRNVGADLLDTVRRMPPSDRPAELVHTLELLTKKTSDLIDLGLTV